MVWAIASDRGVNRSTAPKLRIRENLRRVGSILTWGRAIAFKEESSTDGTLHPLHIWDRRWNWPHGGSAPPNSAPAWLPHAGLNLLKTEDLRFLSGDASIVWVDASKPV
jgi:hypothetical protein